MKIDLSQLSEREKKLLLHSIRYYSEEPSDFSSNPQLGNLQYFVIDFAIFCIENYRKDISKDGGRRSFALGFELKALLAKLEEQAEDVK